MVSDVLGQTVGPIFKFHESKNRAGNRWMHYDAGDDVSSYCFSGTVRNCSTLPDGTNRLSQNVCNQLQMYTV